METDPEYREANRVVLCRLCDIKVKHSNWAKHTENKHHIFWAQMAQHLREDEIKINKWRYIEVDENTKRLEI